jgi:hypothetical protein
MAAARQQQNGRLQLAASQEYTLPTRLTLQIIVVTICATCFNIKRSPRFFQTQYIYRVGIPTNAY